MRVTVLGTGSADGWPNPFCSCPSCGNERAAGRARTPSSALVDDVLLLDCGPTTPHLPGPSGVSLERVEHVLLTHGHPDHLHPAFLLTHRWTGAERVLHVWGPAHAMDQCRDWIGEGSAVALHAVTPGDVIDLPTARGDYRATVLRAEHAHGDGDVMAAEAVLFAIADPAGGRVLYATDTGPFDPGAIGLPPDPMDVVLIDETFGDLADHGTGHLDLQRLPGVLSALRSHGTLGASTTVVVTHLSHHNPPTAHLRSRLAAMGVHVVDDLTVIDTDAPHGGLARRTLLLGGARSGKSAAAERLAAASCEVTYVATGGVRPEDPEWSERIASHRARRPDHWTTLETTDVAGVLRDARLGTVVLVDCLALWLTALLDDLDAWRRLESSDGVDLRADIDRLVDDLVDALRASAADVVLVSNEVGMGVVPASASGRLFRDLLGVLNIRVAEACSSTMLVMAGRPLLLDSEVGLRA